MIISIINATQLPRQEVQDVIRAVNRQLREDFKKYWHKDVELRLEGWAGDALNPQEPLNMRGDAVLYLWDGPDANDALGYHDLNNNGVPYGFVFTTLSDSLGEKWSVTLSHEVLELAMDTEINLLAQGPHPDPDEDGRIVSHWYELCDAVQTQTYQIDGIDVSNFVLPLYFTKGEEHLKHNDFLGLGLKSFGVMQGGYLGFFDPLTQSHENYAAPEDKVAAQRIEKKAAFTTSNRSARRNAGGLLENTKQVYCEAVTFELSGKSANIESAEKLVFERLGNNWVVERCLADINEFDAIYLDSKPLGFAQAWQLCHELTDETSVEWAEPSFVAPVAGETDTPDDDPIVMRMSSLKKSPAKPGTDNHAWALEQCNVPQAWEIIREAGKLPGEGIKIGHPDSGFNQHKEMDHDRILFDFDRDFLDNDKNAQTKKTKNGSHGLATASVIMSGNGNVDDAMQGPALHSKIVPLRVTKPGKFRPAPVLMWSGMRRLRNAIDYASKIDCGVISMSLGGLPSRSLHKAIRRATNSGVIVLAAAGNQVRTVVWPARYKETIAVAGTNINKTPWKGSCSGSAVDISAPAETVWRATINKVGKEVVKPSDGTSYAVAITSGVAALWRSYHKDSLAGVDPATITELFRSALKRSASTNHDLPAGKFGAGILDAEKLLSTNLDSSEALAVEDYDDIVNKQLSELKETRAEKLGNSLKNELLSANAINAVLQVENPKRMRAHGNNQPLKVVELTFSPRLQLALK